jgi:peptide/nickel transport system substrate-binding protein
MHGESKRVGISRRRALVLAASGAAVTLLAACAPIAPANPPASTAAPQTGGAAARAATPPPQSGSPSTAAGQPKRGGTLRIGRANEPSNLDGSLISPYGVNSTWMALDRLMAYDDNLQPQPRLAESWELSSDSTQLKLNLRHGVTFHSGRDFTSEDVKYSLLRVRDPKIGAAQLLAFSNWFTDIQTPDKYTAVLKTDVPRAGIFDAFEYLYIVDQPTMEGPDAKTRVVGTGPFMWSEWQPGVSLRMDRNPNFWDSGKPYFDALMFTTIPDTSALVVSLESKSIDLAESVPLRDGKRLQQDKNFVVYSDTVHGGINMIACNTTVAPTNNKLFRQALNYALDRQHFVSAITLGISEPRVLMWPSQSEAFEASKANAYAFDLDKARSLVAASGISNPSLDFDYTNNDPVGTGLGQIMQADLASIGVTLNLKGMENGPLLAIGSQVGYQGVLQNPASYLQFTPATGFFLNRFINQDNPGGNQTGWQNPQLKQLLQQASSETDPAKRKPLYSQINDIMLDESVMIPVSSSDAMAASLPTVAGLKRLRTNGLTLFEAWFA